MTPDWAKTIKELSIGAIAIAGFVYAVSLLHDQIKYSAETDRENRKQMGLVITECLTAFREDRKELTALSNAMIGLIGEDQPVVKSELQGIIEQLNTQTRSATRKPRK